MNIQTQLFGIITKDYEDMNICDNELWRVHTLYFIAIAGNTSMQAEQNKILAERRVLYTLNQNDVNKLHVFS